MRIRPARSGDAATLALIFHSAVHGIARGDYSADQVRAWSPAPMPTATKEDRLGDGRQVFVAVDARDTPRAFIELEADGHIDCFYCHPDVAGTGVGAALYAWLEAAARQAGIARLYVEASDPARRFFAKQGFSVLHRREFARRGVMLHNHAMEKRLA
ncbi:GNAT family N-acetyltransferase [Mesobaculum littorinae]|uniref:GNAT family N-acetyltransferase n=2 Tax=Mesobaculum littorinae TaxID=2486419 RepID=A0A438ADH4_9RHOB|nr:GNAT family N-acetyltransferase [Mesobaculum littorinae]